MLVLLGPAGTVLFFFDPVATGSRVGALATLTWGLLACMSGLAILRKLSDRYKIPALSFLLSCGLFRAWMWGAPFREVPTQLGERYSSIGSSFKSWIDPKNQSSVVSSPTQRNLILVSAEGGGIRAAAQTLLTLCQLEDEHPGIHKDIFLISAVSGGSLGAILYEGLLIENKFAEHPKESYFSQAEKLLTADYLSAPLGRLFFTDLPFSLVPLNLKWHQIDRSDALSEAFRQNFMNATGADTLSTHLSSLTSVGASQLPILCLNASSAKLGMQRVLGNLDTSELEDKLPDLTVGSRSLDMRLCDAASLSARFPIVTSMGVIRLNDKEEDWLTDGGYCDNSGLETITKVLPNLTSCVERQNKAATKKVRPYVLRICAEESTVSVKLTPRSNWMTTVSPILTTFSVFGTDRDATARSITSNLGEIKGQLGESNFISLSLQLDDSDEEKRLLPLGWQLSQRSLSTIKASVATSIVTANDELRAMTGEDL